MVCVSAVIIMLITLINANHILDSRDHTKIVGQTEHGKLYLTEATDPDGLLFTQPVLHLWGANYYDMGYAHGKLLHQSITQFHFVEAPQWMILGDLAKSVINYALPEDIQTILKNAKGEGIVTAVHTAMDWVYQYQRSFTDAQTIQFDNEIRGIADGYCDAINAIKSSSPNKPCDKEVTYTTFRAMNVFPELVRMGCSILGTWGTANSGLVKNNPEKYSDLIQARLLDFGIGPFVNNQVLVIRHFGNFTNVPERSVDFVTQGFPAFVGSVTTFSEHVSQSQKVFLDFIDRGDDGEHRAPEFVRKHTIEIYTPEEIAQNKAKIEQYLLPDEITGSKIDLIQANLRAANTLTVHNALSHAQKHPMIPTKTSYHKNQQTLLSMLQQLPTSSVWTEIKLLQQNKLTDDEYIAIWTQQLNIKQQRLDQTLSSEYLNHRYNNDQSIISQIFTSTPKVVPSSFGLQGYRPGTYSGLADIFAIRVLTEQTNQSLSQVIATVNALPRTWPIFLAYGTSIKNQDKILSDGTPIVTIGYEPVPKFYNDMTLPLITSYNVINDVQFIDRRPQPSPETKHQKLLLQSWGQYNIEWMLQTLPQFFTSGDVHATFYDWNEKNFYVSLGRLDENYDWGEYGKALQRPWMKYTWAQLLDEEY